ncbi:unnamed protein product, partial [Ixodes pacificus]
MFRVQPQHSCLHVLVGCPGAGGEDHLLPCVRRRPQHALGCTQGDDTFGRNNLHRVGCGSFEASDHGRCWPDPAVVNE